MDYYYSEGLTLEIYSKMLKKNGSAFQRYLLERTKPKHVTVSSQLLVNAIKCNKLVRCIKVSVCILVYRSQ